MSDSARSMNVLKKILNSSTVEKKTESNAEEVLEKFLRPAPAVVKKQANRPGRPKVDDDKKAKNITLCLATKYLKFLDQLEIKNKKLTGRGRKVRYIIDRFIELENRQNLQLAHLKEALSQVEKTLKGLSGQVHKGKKLELTPKEKTEISKVVGQVHILMKVLAMSSKSLYSTLPRDQWAIVSFCLDWVKTNRTTK